jgi:hypothetical protein
MGLSGTFRTMLPGDLLQWLSLGEKNGLLLVINRGVEKRVFFKDGRVISTASNDPREYLGQFLISHGFLSEQELVKAMEVQQQSGILLGKILVMIDVISEEDLQRLMRIKAEEEMYDIFLWPEAAFHFEDEELPTMQMIPLQVEVTGIIMEGHRRLDEWKRIREVIPHDSVVPVIEKPVDLKHLEEVQRTIVQAIDARRSIADIVLESRSSSFVVSSTLMHLVRAGSVRLEERAAAKEAEPKKARAQDVSEADEVASLLNRAQEALRNKDYEKTQRLLKAAEDLHPNHARVRSAIKGAEAVILADLHGQGLNESRVPRMTRRLEEITGMNFTPNEGFILSRINGEYDIGSLMKISPIREPDAMLIFYRLWRDGIIVFE